MPGPARTPPREVFGVSVLDLLCCALAGMVLLFVVLSSKTSEDRSTATDYLLITLTWIPGAVGEEPNRLRAELENLARVVGVGVSHRTAGSKPTADGKNFQWLAPQLSRADRWSSSARLVAVAGVVEEKGRPALRLTVSIEEPNAGEWKFAPVLGATTSSGEIAVTEESRRLREKLSGPFTARVQGSLRVQPGTENRLLEPKQDNPYEIEASLKSNTLLNSNVGTLQQVFPTIFQRIAVSGTGATDTSCAFSFTVLPTALTAPRRSRNDVAQLVGATSADRKGEGRAALPTLPVGFQLPVLSNEKARWTVQAGISRAGELLGRGLEPAPVTWDEYELVERAGGPRKRLTLVSPAYLAKVLAAHPEISRPGEAGPWPAPKFVGIDVHEGIPAAAYVLNAGGDDLAVRLVADELGDIAHMTLLGAAPVTRGEWAKFLQAATDPQSHCVRLLGPHVLENDQHGEEPVRRVTGHGARLFALWRLAGNTLRNADMVSITSATSGLGLLPPYDVRYSHTRDLLRATRQKGAYEWVNKYETRGAFTFGHVDGEAPVGAIAEVGKMVLTQGDRDVCFRLAISFQFQRGNSK
jgi:hypothetical protein